MPSVHEAVDEKPSDLSIEVEGMRAGDERARLNLDGELSLVALTELQDRQWLVLLLADVDLSYQPGTE